MCRPVCGWGSAGCTPSDCLRLAVVNAAICRVFLQGAKANALRLNELSHPELLQMAALISAQLARLRRTPCTAGAGIGVSCRTLLIWDSVK